MTRRERKEARIARRLEWAAGRDQKAEQGFDRARRIADGIPLGQPILVGHHSERRHRRDLERIDSGMRQVVESAKMAEQHRSTAAEIGRQLDRSVFSDDADALEALEARIAEHEATRARMKEVNRLYKKGDAAGLEALGLNLEALRAKLAEAGPYWGKAPHLPYELSNLGGRIAADRKRLELIRAQQGRAAAAEAAPGGVVIEGAEWVRVTFAEKPSRAILDALRAAGFRWGAGSWVGERAKLPAEVQA